MGIRCAALLVTVVLTSEAGAAEIISVSAGPTRETNVYFMDAVVEIDAPPSSLRRVIFQMCDHKEAMQHVAYCRTFNVEGATAWSYMVIDVPIFEPRDYTLASTVDEDFAPDGTGTFRSHWVADNRRGPRDRPGITRLDVNHGSWTMKPLDGGKRTWLHYSVRVNPGGNIPAWVAGYVSRKTLPDYMRTLERLAREDQSKSRRDGRAVTTLPARPLDAPLPPVERRYGNALTAWLP